MFKTTENQMDDGDIPIKINSDIKDNAVNIEDILSSRGRVLILKTLAEMEELNISAIARIANLNHSTTTQHLEFLKKAGLIQEKRFGRIKIFRFKNEDLKARSLKRLFEIWD